MTTQELLLEYTLLMNAHGTDSPQANKFYQEHQQDSEFERLGMVAHDLKKALSIQNSG